MKENPQKKFQLKKFLLQLLFGVTGVISMQVIVAYANINFFLAISILVVTVVFIFPTEYAPIFHASCLAGIMKPRTFYHEGFLFVTGLIVVMINRIFLGKLMNTIGRPGIIAYISNLLTFLFVYLISLSKVFYYDPYILIFDYLNYTYLNVYFYVFGPIFAAYGCVCVYLLEEYRKDIVKLTHRSICVYIVTGISAVYLFCFQESYYTYNGVSSSYGANLIQFVHVGALGGTTIPTVFYNYIPNYSFYHYMIFGYFGGWAFLGLTGIGFFGGKPGVSIFLGGITYHILLRIFFNKKIKIKEKEKIEKEKQNKKVFEIVIPQETKITYEQTTYKNIENYKTEDYLQYQTDRNHKPVENFLKVNTNQFLTKYNSI